MKDINFMITNQYNQPIGDALPNFSVGKTPHITKITALASNNERNVFT